MQTWLSIGLGLALALVTGCARQDKNAVSEHQPPPAPRVESQAHATGEPFKVIRVFYGTNRRPTGTSEPNRYYGSTPGDIQLGLCEVSIPPDHEVGELEKPSIWKLEFREDPEKHVVLMDVQPTDGNTFLSELQTMVDASQSHEAFVFIHGYNVTFKDAARRTAQIAHDLRFDGAPIMYSWPAKGELIGYRKDERAAADSVPYVRQFVEAIARRSGARRIHLIAHSMGNRVLAGALSEIAARGTGGVRFNEVILTAPDIDAEQFKREIAGRIVQSADRVTIYASSNDRALLASKVVHGNSRLGLAGRHLTVFPEIPAINVVDASSVDTSLFGHSYYGDSETVLNDVGAVFRGSDPQLRGLQPLHVQNAWSMVRGRVAARPDTRGRF